MKKRSPLDYIFAVGKIRALERFLIKEEVFQQAVEADLNEALRLFVESDLYSDELLRVQDSQRLEELLQQELVNLKKLIRGLLLDNVLLGLLELDSVKCVQEILKGYPNDFLENYLRQLIDMHNIKIFLRMRILKEPPSKLRENLICEGFIKKEEFLKLYDQDLAAFLLRLEYVLQRGQIVDYTSALQDGINRAIRERSFAMLEKVMQSFLIRALKPAKYLTFGPEPLLAYYFAKVNEINLMRLIILAKLNNASADLVRERLNEVYS